MRIALQLEGLMTDQGYEDWLDDFGAVVLTDSELQAMEDLLEGESNAEMRRLVKEARCMRWAARVLRSELRERGQWPESTGPQERALGLAAWLIDVRDRDREGA